MTVPLVVEAKLQVPRAHRQPIARSRLLRLLEAAGARPLTVVCAPAGFGKTTALVQWVDATRSPVAWLSLDARDDDPRHLLAHLLAALARLAPDATSAAEQGLRDGADLFETVLPLTLDALAVVAEPDGVAVVLDDLHLVDDPDCHRLLASLADTLPPSARLVVASRAAPPRLARRRSAGAVSTIGPEALAFRPAEVERLLNGALELALRPDQLAAVEEHVGGWPVGLALIGAAMPTAPDRERFRRAFARSRREVVEYLVEEVLAQLDPALRRFLRRTSILGRLDERLCEAVLDDPAAGQLLARARRAQLLVTADDVDAAGTWVRGHRSLAEPLERELRAREPQLVPLLHLRAADWFEREGRIEEALAHASAAGDGHAAAAALDGSSPDELDAGLRALRARMREEPPPARAGVASLLGTALWFAGENDAARLLLESQLDAMVDRHRVWSLATLALAALDSGRELEALAHADAALVLVERSDGSAFERAYVQQAIARVARAAGQREQAERALARAARPTSPVPGSLHDALTLLIRAELALDRGDRAVARASAAAVRATVDRDPDVGVLGRRLAAIERTLARDDELFGTPPTRAERRALDLLPSELSRSQIAAALYLTPDTVNSHLRRVFRRLGVRSRAEAVVAARARGLLPPLRAEAGDDAAAAARRAPS